MACQNRNKFPRRKKSTFSIFENPPILTVKSAKCVLENDENVALKSNAKFTTIFTDKKENFEKEHIVNNKKL